MRSYFSCVYGSCDNCLYKTTLGCVKYGECSFCLAQYSDFCTFCRSNKY